MAGNGAATIVQAADANGGDPILLGFALALIAFTMWCWRANNRRKPPD